MPWQVDPQHTSVMFAAQHFGLVDMRGIIEKVEGTVEFDAGKGLPSSVVLTFDARTLQSGSAARDEQLRGDRFLDVTAFPEIRFVSHEVVPDGSGGRCRITGELTIHGVARPATLEVQVVGPVKNPRGALVVGLRTETVLDRKDFGMTNVAALENGALITGDRIRVAVDLEAVAPS